MKRLQMEENTLVNFEGCDICGGLHNTELCPALQQDERTTPNISRARLTLPHFLKWSTVKGGNSPSIIARDVIESKTRLGPFDCPRNSELKQSTEDTFTLKAFTGKGAALTLETSNEWSCNWMCLVHTALTCEEQNLIAVQMGDDIYYITTKRIACDEELKVWYAPHYAKKMGKSVQPDGFTKIPLIRKTTDTTIYNEMRSDNASIPDDGNETEVSEFPETPESTQKVLDELANPRAQFITQPVTGVGSRVCRRCGFVAETVHDMASHVRDVHLIINRKRKTSPTTHKEKSTDSESPNRKMVKISDSKPISDIKDSMQIKVSQEYPQLSISSKQDQDCGPQCTENQKSFHLAEDVTHTSKDAVHKALMNSQSNLKSDDASSHVSCENQEKNTVQISEESRDDSKNSEVLHLTDELLQLAEDSQMSHVQMQVANGESQVQLPVTELKQLMKNGVGSLVVEYEHVISKDSDSTNSNVLNEPANNTVIMSNDTSRSFDSASKIVSRSDIEIDVQKKESPTHDLSLKNSTNNTAKESSLAEIEEKKIKERNQKEPSKSSPPKTLHVQIEKENVLNNGSELDDKRKDGKSMCKRHHRQNNEKANVTLEIEILEEKTGVNNSDISTCEGHCFFKDEDIEKIFKKEDLSAGESDEETTDFSSHIEIQLTMDEKLMDLREDSGVFICELCNRRFSSKWRLAKHLHNHPDLSCAKCGKCFREKCSLEKHSCLKNLNVRAYLNALQHCLSQHVVVNEDNELYQCLACGQLFKNLTSLLRHVIIHDGVFVCQECGHCFESKTSFDNHTVTCGMTKEDRGSSFVCDLCGRLFTKQMYLKRHLQSHQAVYNCDKCGLKFMHSATFRAHDCSNEQEKNGTRKSTRSMKRTAKGHASEQNLSDSENDSCNKPTPHFCEFCGVKFETKQTLAAHMTSHMDDFHCKKCDVHYSKEKSWLQHMAKCDPDTLKAKSITYFPCESCDKVFTKKYTLLYHERIHLNAFQCDKCLKSFGTTKKLITHACMGPEPERYECKECGRSFKKKAFLERHMPLHTGEFTCVICSKAFERKETLIKHMLHCTASAQVSSFGNIPCTICKEEFTDPRKFQAHYMVHTHPFACDKCDQRFMRRINLDKHTCTANNKQSFPCSECGKVFKKEAFLERHMHVHSGKVWHCDRCGRDFQRPDMWRIHMCKDKDGNAVQVHYKKNGAQVREEYISTQCTICGRSFHNKSNLDKHVKRHFDKSEACHKCDKKFHDKAGLKAHLENVHGTGEKRFKCEFCDKLMKCRNSLYAHRRAFHSEKQVVYQCTECNKQFQNKSYLAKHLETKHSANPSTPMCLLCAKPFRSQEMLDRHAQWHEIGSYQCDFCDLTFQQLSEVTRHMSKEHAGYVFVCEFCNQNFNQPFIMTRHLEKCHTTEWLRLSDRKNYVRKQATYISEYAAQNKPLKRNTGFPKDEVQFVTGIPEELAGNQEHEAILAERTSSHEPVDNYVSQAIPTQGGADIQTVTQINETELSEEVLSALRNMSGDLNVNATLDVVSSQNIHIEGKDGQSIPVTIPSGLTDGQGFIVLPPSNEITQPNGTEFTFQGHQLVNNKGQHIEDQQIMQKVATTLENQIVVNGSDYVQVQDPVTTDDSHHVTIVDSQGQNRVVTMAEIAQLTNSSDFLSLIQEAQNSA